MSRLVLPLALCATPSWADEAKLVTSPFYEVVRPSGNLSGVVVVGVMGETAEPSDQLRLAAALPAGWPAEAFCAKVATADGRLTAVNDYERLEGAVVGAVDLPFETSRDAEWAQIPEGEVAVLVTGRPCDAPLAPDEDETAAVALWNRADSGPVRRVRLLINSTQADEVYLFVGDEATEPTPCEPVADQPRAVFDMTCRFDLPEGGETRVEINRVRSGRLEPPQHLVLRHGG